MTTAPSNDSNTNLLNILLQHKVITQVIYDEVKQEIERSGKTIDYIATEQNLVNPHDLLRAKSELFHIPFIDVRNSSIAPQAMAFIPQAVAKRFKVFPYAYQASDKLLSVVMVNPLDLNTIDFLQRKSQCKIQPAFGVEADILKTIQERYAQGLTKDVDKALAETGDTGEKVLDEESIHQVIREAPIAKIVTTILSFATKSQASDVHIEPMEDKTRIRYRIDGMLHEKLVLPKKVHEAVISRIKILANLKIDEKRIPQDGRFNFRSEEQEVDLRVSTLPSINGEKVVMRLLKKSGDIPTLQELGLRGKALKNVEEGIRVPHGIILITGPTGSGKTTTLYSILHKLNTSQVNIITLEDPVEYELEGINQVQINPQAGLTFASGLRSILRQDPNIIMVGEIRDAETAELSVHAALTGHLVFATLHTNSAAGALPRLIDMNIEPFLLASAMNLVMAQRVMRKICEECKESYQPTPDIVENIKEVLGIHFDHYYQNGLKLYRGKKCNACNNTGYSGRIGIFEVMPITEKISLLATSRRPASEIQAESVKNGMMTMIMDGYIKALEGQTTLEEVLRVSRF